MKEYFKVMGVAAILFISVIIGLGLGWEISTSIPVDPAIAALQEAKYTQIHFVGERKGVCNTDKEIVEALIGLNVMPTTSRKGSSGKDCFFGDRWIAKDVVGHIEMGNVYCGELVKSRYPFKYCDIIEDSSVGATP